MAAVVEAASPPPPPRVPAPESAKVVSFSTSDVPIQAVTVFCKNEAEVTRPINFLSSKLGRHQVELTDLPGQSLIDGTSVRVKGSGHCTILNVSYSDQPKDAIKTELTQEEKDAETARKEKLNEDIQRLTDELTALNQQSARNKLMREYADRFAERTVTATAGESANAAAAVGASDSGPAPSVDDVGKALDWWAARAVQTDAEVHRLELEGRRLKHAIDELRKALRVNPTSMLLNEQAMNLTKKSPGRVLITIDVQELSPIELQVKYMTKGATWSPSYDLRVDTQTDSVSCTYYGMVTQYTTEDWNGIALRLSTAEPTVHGTPPALGSKTVALKAIPLPVSRSMRMKKSMSRRSSSRAEDGDDGPAASYTGFMSSSDLDLGDPYGFGGAGVGGGGGYGSVPGAPPPPPPAKPAVALVEGGGGGGMGVVSFAVEEPADIKSDRRMKKMTIGILQLSAEVTHYVVPAKEAAAYLQAKATNNTDYLLLASDDVSIFFDNSFVTKTSLTSVSPGESFQTFLGIDPAVKINVAPVRKTSKKRGTFSKSNHVTYTHSSSISNKKRVPVTCVIVDAMPRSTNDVIKVTLKQPAPAGVSESQAISDDVLVTTALEMFGGGSGGDANGGQHPRTRTDSGVTGVIKSPTNHLAWVGKIAPQGQISIPLEFTLEWPSEKEIEIHG